jgi:hypothetical protein
MKSPAAKELASLGGLYNVVLILGDGRVKNPVFWRFADVQLTAPSAQISAVFIYVFGETNIKIN